MASKVNFQGEIIGAFSRKEKTESLLNKLNENDSSISEEQRSSLKAEYEGTISKANEDVLKIKERISEQIAVLQSKLDTLKKDNNTLDARFKVGEIDSEIYRKQGRNIAQETAKTSEEISKYVALLNAKSAKEVEDNGINFNTDERKVDLQNLPKVNLQNLPSIPSEFNILKDLQLSDFTTFIHYSDFEFTKMNIIVVIGTCLMVLSLVLPWVSALGVSSGAGLHYFVLALIAIPAILLKNNKASGIVFTLVGMITFLIDIYILLTFQQYSGYLTLVGASLNVGFYLNLIGGLALTCVGILRLKDEFKFKGQF